MICILLSTLLPFSFKMPSLSFIKLQTMELQCGHASLALPLVYAEHKPELMCRLSLELSLQLSACFPHWELWSWSIPAPEHVLHKQHGEQKT